MLKDLWAHAWFNNLVASIVFVIALLILRALTLRWIKASPIKSGDYRRRWLGWIHQAFIFTAILGLIIIWATEIQTLAISLVAFAVAIILATKELILCFTGGMLKASTGMFTIGDRIRINDFRGQVVSQGILSTKLLEIGPGERAHQYTGRTLNVPNSLLLSVPTVNETITGRYGFLSFTVPINIDEDWRLHQDWLLEAAELACKPHIDDARRNIDAFVEKKFMDNITANPRVVLTIPDADHIELVVRVPVPGGEEGRIQRLIIRKYLQLRQPHEESEVSNDSSNA
ncbi:Mechanosensitive ion channel [Poriferisphaera corsica]|uniref:Mechanosensitive ion channel n=1 Tax=Poriferisphaera corsica TaxID=2528020 RepID=A0A517YRN0_9BACT|nr:mechanosensitive ion channel domain-containing protein [Poriferisphaera corsica]QDU32882.1 Mechanosensitive ion channel [Poriferisphaera corsica]